MNMIEQVKSRVQTAKGKVLSGQLMGQLGGGLLSGQQKRLGGGSMMKTVRSTADRVARQAMERKPGVISMVSEFKPGSRISSALAGQRSVGTQRGASVIGSAAKISGGKIYASDRRGKGPSTRARSASIAT